MANLTSIRDIASTPRYPVSKTPEKNNSERHAMVCLFSRGNHPSVIDYVKRLASQSDIPHCLLGDLTYINDPAESLSTDSLIPLVRNEEDDIVHNVYIFHGGISDGKHLVNVRHGDLTEVSTSALLRSMHWPVSQTLAQTSQAGTAKKYKTIDYHFSCNGAKLRDEFSAEEAFWKSNVSLIFSSKKATAFDQMGTALESALRYVSYCNKPGNQSTVDQFKLFLYAGMRRGDCLTMLGGELKAPLIWHAPKNHDDLLLQNMLGNVRGHETDCETLKQAALALTVAQVNLLPPVRYQLRDMFFTRISRNDGDSVAQLLKQDGDLKNEKSDLGNPALIWAIIVKAHQCTDLLLSADPDVNAIDAYGSTALIHALVKDEPELVRRLLKKGANPNARNFDGASPLMIAVSKGWLQQVQDLIKFHAKTDVWNKKQTALTMAVDQGDYDIVDALLLASDNGAIGLDWKLIEQAEEQGDISIVDLLKRSMAKDEGNDDWVDMEIDQAVSINQ